MTSHNNNSNFNQSGRRSFFYKFLIGLVCAVCFVGLYFSLWDNTNHNTQSPLKLASSSSLSSTSSNKNNQQPSKKSKNAPPKIFIISYSDSSAATGYLHAAMIRLCYAKQFSNYQVIIYDEYDLRRFSASSSFSSSSSSSTKKDPDEVKYWSKLYLMKKTLLLHTRSQKEWVFWIDADAIITRPNLRLETIINSGIS